MGHAAHAARGKVRAEALALRSSSGIVALPGALPGPCRRKDSFARAAAEGAPRPLSQPSAFQSRFFTAADGLRLHMRDYGPRASTALPIVCLPGLARTAGDFDPLARALCGSRRVVALDYRGRGLSERDKDWKNYDIMVENADILTVLTGAGIAAAIFVGTSRGGLHIMVTAATRPTLLRGAVLNDIGPVIEPKGLMRIRGYVGTLPQPSSWADAVDLLKATASAQFTALDDADWEAYARLTFEQRHGRFVPQYDPLLAKGPRNARPRNAPARPLAAVRGPAPRFRSSSSAARIPISWRRRPSRKCCAATPVASFIWCRARAMPRCCATRRRSRGSPPSWPRCRARTNPTEARPWRPLRSAGMVAARLTATAPNTTDLARWRCGREAEGGGLLNRYRVVKPYRGFESPPSPPTTSQVPDLAVVSWWRRFGPTPPHIMLVPEIIDARAGSLGNRPVRGRARRVSVLRQQCPGRPAHPRIRRRGGHERRTAWPPAAQG